MLPKLGIHINNLVFNEQSQAAMYFKESDVAADEWH